MDFGPAGKVDWPAQCDAEWSDLMGVCSDANGTPVKQDGSSASYFDVVSEITRKTVAPPNSAAVDPLAWFKQGYNLVYVAAGFVLLLMLMSGLKGGRR